MPLLNYTTKVNAQKTVTEVMGLLVAKGADEISIVYDDNQQPCWPEVDRPESPAGQGKFRLALQHRCGVHLALRAEGIGEGTGVPPPAGNTDFLANPIRR